MNNFNVSGVIFNSFVLVYFSPETLFQSYCSREYTDEEISAVPKSILPRSASSDENATPPRVNLNSILNVTNPNIFQTNII